MSIWKGAFFSLKKNVFIDFHGLQYSVQQISYKSGQSIINDQEKEKEKK